MKSIDNFGTDSHAPECITQGHGSKVYAQHTRRVTERFSRIEIGMLEGCPLVKQVPCFPSYLEKASSKSLLRAKRRHRRQAVRAREPNRNSSVGIEYIGTVLRNQKAALAGDHARRETRLSTERSRKLRSVLSLVFRSHRWIRTSDSSATFFAL